MLSELLKKLVARLEEIDDTPPYKRRPVDHPYRDLGSNLVYLLRAHGDALIAAVELAEAAKAYRAAQVRTAASVLWGEPEDLRLEKERAEKAAFRDFVKVADAKDRAAKGESYGE